MPEPRLNVPFSSRDRIGPFGSFRGIPDEVLRERPEDLLRLRGYAKGSYSLGFVDGGRDPISGIRPELERLNSPGNYEAAAGRQEFQIYTRGYA